jgi:transposase-like protein
MTKYPAKPAQLQNTIFVDENEARKALEQVRWPNGAVCPHCGVTGNGIVKVEGKKQSHRPGLYYCNHCKGQFTVTVGTVFERSKIPLTKWWMAVYLLNSSKKGISPHQIHRTLKVSYKTAWFMMHRIREAMRTGGLGPMGGSGKVVEVDETYIGRQEGQPAKAGPATKNIVLTLVERGGSVRSFHIDSTSIADIAPILRENIKRESGLMTDQARHYIEVGQEFASHDAVNHSEEEYARYASRVDFPNAAPYVITTNTVEGYYSIFKRGMKGVYQHCKEKHLHRYLAEFDFRYSNRVALGVNDGERAILAMKGIEGKRLTYRPTNKAIG